MAVTTRRKFLIGGSSLLIAAGATGWYFVNQKAPLGMKLDEKTLQRGSKFLNNNVSIDIHAHPGRSFVENGENLSTQLKLYSMLGSFEEDTIDELVIGDITMTTFATVADFQLLGIADTGGLKSVREFNKGEAWKSYQTQMTTLKEQLSDCRLMPILKPQDIFTAKQNHKIGAFFTSEGADFLEGSLEHLQQCYVDGMRSLTLVHYHINEIGDIQTQLPRYNTLTAFGIELVKAMNKKGMLIDLAHAAKGTSMKAMEITEKPVMISHSAIRRKGFDSKRFIGMDEAKMVAETGGIIGAWPAGLGGLLTLSDYVDQIFQLVDEVGIDHVAIGTDMDANYKPVFHSYLQAPILAGTLLNRGMSEKEASKLWGGNFMRVFQKVAE